MKTSPSSENGGAVPAPRRPADPGILVSTDIDDAHTGLPGLRTWRSVYVVVGGIFVLWVALLVGLSALYS